MRDRSNFIRKRRKGFVSMRSRLSVLAERGIRVFVNKSDLILSIFSRVKFLESLRVNSTRRRQKLLPRAVKLAPSIKALARFIEFKGWDLLEESDEPDVVIFFAVPDVLSGPFTLAGFDETEPNIVFTPFGSGCSSIV
jgi:hypothetical protein